MMAFFRRKKIWGEVAAFFLPIVAWLSTATAEPTKPAPPMQAQAQAQAQAKKPALTVKPAAPAQAEKPPSPPAVVANKTVALKLAPNAAEVEAERHSSNAPPVPKPKDPRDNTPKQDSRFPTHVDYTRGPGSPLGGGTSGDRKATLQDATGPQQGVIRNRW